MTRLADGGPYCADVQEAKHCLSLISLFLIAFYHVYDIVENLFFDKFPVVGASVSGGQFDFRIFICIY